MGWSGLKTVSTDNAINSLDVCGITTNNVEKISCLPNSLANSGTSEVMPTLMTSLMTMKSIVNSRCDVDVSVISR